MNRISGLLMIAAMSATMLAGCDDVFVDEQIQSAPVIEAFTPESAPVGAEIVVTGQYLNAVNKAYIGDTEVTIIEKVSDTRLSILAAAAARDGKITLVNAAGRGESEHTFTFAYAVPELIGNLLPASIDMGGELLLTGTNMTAVEAVLFTAEGYDEPKTAEIKERNTTEILVRVPYVESDRADITLRYFNGTSSVATSRETAPSLDIVRNKPEFDTPTFERTAVGRTVTITGRYLDKVDKILVNGFEAVVNKQPTTLTFTVPAGDFADGETVTSVVAEYFDGHESSTLSEEFVVFVPFVKFWENMRTWAQSREVEQFASFFSPETGRVYANSDWRTEVDPISYEYKSQVCTAGNVPNTAMISKEQYLSVKPYFFFSGVSNGNVQLNGPANSVGQIKNFFMSATSSNDNRCLGANVDAYGTPVIAYRYLNPANATEKALIDKVINQQIERIDEESFPVDVANQSVAGIGITSCEGTTTTAKWAVGTDFVIKQPADNIKIDAVIMVFYYGYGGYNGNFAQNILRIGFVHIVSMNHRLDSSNQQPSRSDVTFNCYWQKYDYDYSKIPQ